MSEESNDVVLSTEKGENLENEIVKDNNSKPAFHPGDSPLAGDAEVPEEKVQVHKNQQPIEHAQPEQNGTSHGSLKSNEEAADSSPYQPQLRTFNASTETKSLQMRADGNQPAVKTTTSDGSTDTKSLERVSGNEPSVKSTTSDESTDTKFLERSSDNAPSVKSTTSDGSTNTKSLERVSDVNKPNAKSTPSEIFPSEAPSSDKGLEKVTENIQLIYEGLKDMKISTEEIPVSASGKKGRKAPGTPRARSTPALTSPPLTRSRSRDLRKFPSTPSSPKRSAIRNTSEGDSDEIKVRGRQRAKKN